MKKNDKRIAELETEIESDNQTLLNIDSQMNVLQQQRTQITQTILTKVGGVAELKRLENDDNSKVG